MPYCDIYEFLKKNLIPRWMVPGGLIDIRSWKISSSRHISERIRNWWTILGRRKWRPIAISGSTETHALLLSIWQESTNSISHRGCRIVAQPRRRGNPWSVHAGTRIHSRRSISGLGLRAHHHSPSPASFFIIRIREVNDLRLILAPGSSKHTLFFSFGLLGRQPLIRIIKIWLPGRWNGTHFLCPPFKSFASGGTGSSGWPWGWRPDPGGRSWPFHAGWTNSSERARTPSHHGRTSHGSHCCSRRAHSWRWGRWEWRIVII